MILNQSLTSRITEFILQLINTKKAFTTRENALEHMKKAEMENQKGYKVPFPFSKKLKCFYFKDMQTFFLEGKSKDIILYIPGGAFVSNPHLLQWNFIFDIQNNTACNMIVPIYPKAPSNTYKQTYKKLIALYESILDKKPNNISFMGDSAGGNIALSLAIQLKEKNLKQPKNIVLFSPCLDLTLSDPAIKDFEKLDPMLAPDGLLTMYQAWAGKTKLTNKILSPINANLKGLGKISLFIGTHEILLPEARRFYEKTKKQNIQINYFEKEGLNHVYPAHPIPEAKQAIKQIVEILKN